MPWNSGMPGGLYAQDLLTKAPPRAPGYLGPTMGSSPQLNPDGSYRQIAMDAPPSVMGGQPAMGSPSLLDYNAWNKQQATPATDQMESGYGNYVNDYYNQAMHNPSMLPQGFLNSEYGRPYLGALNGYLNRPEPQDENGQIGRAQTLMWLQNAPQAFASGRSLGQFQAPVGDSMYDAMSVAVPIIGGAASGGLFNVGMAGVNAAVPNSAPTPPIGVPSQAEVNQFANSGGGMNSVPVPGGGGNAEPGQGGLFDSLLGGLGNLSPAILAGYLGNRQRQDVMGQVGRLNTLGDSLSGPAFMNSITNPYDLQTGQGRTALTQNLQQRGVGGSSFGNQQLGNYDYMRGLGRGDLATRAQAGIAGTQGQLYSDALRGIVGGNAAYNQLLGGGLGASGSLFNRPGGIGSTGNGLFDWLRNLGGGGGSPGVPGVPGDPNIDPNTGLPANYPPTDQNIDPYTGFPTDTGGTFDPNIDWSNLYG